MECCVASEHAVGVASSANHVWKIAEPWVMVKYENLQAVPYQEVRTMHDSAGKQATIALRTWQG